MGHTVCLVLNVSSVSGRSKNIGSLMQAHLLSWPTCLVGQHTLFWFSGLYPVLALALVKVDFLKTNMP